MLFSGKENVFMCLVAFQKMFRKIFSDVWLCSWKYHRKTHFLLVAHIFLVTKRLYNIIYSSKHKQNPEKNHQIRTNEGEIVIGEIAIAPIAIGAFGASRDRDRDPAKIEAEIAIVIGATVLAGDVGGQGCHDRFSLSLSLSLSLSSIFQGQKYFEVKIEKENHFRCFGSQIWSTGNAFQFWPNLK